MSADRTNETPANPVPLRRHLGIFAIALLVVLAFLFSKSMKSELVLFSNDAPLGYISSESGRQASTFSGLFTGFWQDLNWIGEERPSVLPSAGFFGFQLLRTPVNHAKYYVPLTLFLLGGCAWLFFRQMKFHPVVCTLGAFAAALNMNSFSNACWGLPSRATTMASIFLALAAIHSSQGRHRILKLVLAGAAVGHAVMEGFDVGALYSLGVAAFAFFIFFQAPGETRVRAIRGVSGVAVVAIAAAIFAAQALSTLIGTQVKGVDGMGQDEAAKQARWNNATQWSLPISETLRVAIPGLYGYRMTDLGGQVTESSYWGGVGRSPGWETTGAGLPRHSGSGEHAGVLVVLVALWVLVQSFRRENSVLSEGEKRLVWFWAGLTVLSLFLAYGRHAPFYSLFYKLPFSSTIRNPIKFMHLFHLGLIVLGGLGFQAIWQTYVETAKARSTPMMNHFKAWWKTVTGFDRKWIVGCIVFLGATIMAWLVYAASGAEMVRFLEKMGMPNQQVTSIHQFSLKEVGWSIFFLGAGMVSLALIMSGGFGGERRKWAGVVLGVLLVADLARANTPWIQYYDYTRKYTSNPVLDILGQDSHERRVTATLNPFSPNALVVGNEQGAVFNALYNSWLQNQFQFLNIHSLDVIQMPRPQVLDLSFGGALTATSQTDSWLFTRLWELTSTRYLMGMAGFADVLNQQFDPLKQRFKVHTRFDFAQKPNTQTQNGMARLEDLTAVTNTNGNFAIFEFQGALPKAKLYTNWLVLPEDTQALGALRQPDFDAQATVIVSDAAPAPEGPSPNSEGDGSVSITRYSPKNIALEANPSVPSILLLNDRWHPQWNVWVDGEPATLLRCNYIMRGVLLSPGAHKIEFRFQPPIQGLYLSLFSLLAVLVIGAYLIVPKREAA